MSSAQLQPAYPSDASGIAAWIHQADAARAQSGRRSGYVDVEDLNFHVAQTQDGPIVSRVQWRSSEEGHLVPVHNMFSVTAQDRDLALGAWFLKLDAEETLEQDAGEPGRPRAGTGRMR